MLFTLLRKLRKAWTTPNMGRKPKKVRRACPQVERLEDRDVPAVFHWIGPALDSGAFGNASDWDLGSVPGPNDTAEYGAGAESCILDRAYTVGKLQIDPGYTGTLYLLGNKLTTSNFNVANGVIQGQGGQNPGEVAIQSANQGSFELSGGLLTQLTLTLGVLGGGTAGWTGGTIDNSTWNIANPLQIAGQDLAGGSNNPNNKIIQLSTVNIQNTSVTWFQGTVYLSSGSTFLNTGTLEIQGAQKLGRLLIVGAGPSVFNNSGTVKKTGDGRARIYSTFQNNGIVQVLSGTQEFDGNVTVSALFTTMAGTAVDFSQAGIAATDTVAANFQFQGPGQMILDQATLVVNQGLDVVVPNFLLENAGTLLVNGTFEATEFTWQGGAIVGNGQVVVGPTDHVAIQAAGFDNELQGATIWDFGVIDWTGGDVNVTQGGVIEVGPSGAAARLDIWCNGTLESTDGFGAINVNLGGILDNPGFGLPNIDITINNLGGKIDLNGPIP
jgi:hypothetical protein